MNCRSRLALDRLILLDVVLVVDVADDLLDDVLERDESGDTAVLVDDDGHVIAARAEFAQQHVEAFALGHEHRRPHQLPDVEFRRAASPAVYLQEVLREQDACDRVAIVADHRKARVTRLDHHRHDVIERRVAFDDRHLRARHHDVAHQQVRDREHALDHRECVRVEEAALRGLAQHFDELGAILRLAAHALRDAAQPAAGTYSLMILRPWWFQITYGFAVAEPGEDADFARFHRARGARTFMVVTEKMQCPVHDKVRPVGIDRLALCARLGGNDRRADDEIPEQPLAGRLPLRRRERQDVRRAIARTIGRVESPAFGCDRRAARRSLRVPRCRR